MAKNPYDGKVFEADFGKSCLAFGIQPIRLFDPVGHFKGVSNICDFIIYRYPSMVCFELKSTINTRFSFSAITDTQYTGMLAQVIKNDAVAGILIHFTKEDCNETVFVPILVIRDMKEDGLASISYIDAVAFGVVLDSKLKRTQFNYFPDATFFSAIGRCSREWEKRKLEK